MAGETGPVHASRAMAMLIAAFFAVSCYNVLELTISIFTVFKRRRGLYFWSMLVATWGILLHSIAVFLRYFALAPNLPMCVLVCIGWYGMVTGQSVVLYSRLHLVTADKRRYRWVLYMIITNFFILHVPVTILFLASNAGAQRFLNPFNIYEKVQLAGFCTQEIIISGIYIYEARTSLKPVFAMKSISGKKVMLHLVLVNIIAILLDASLLATEYSNNFDVQTTYKPVVYSIKLKMEFSVLNRLISLVHSNLSTDECFNHGPSQLPSSSARMSGSVGPIASFSNGHDLETIRSPDSEFLVDEPYRPTPALPPIIADDKIPSPRPIAIPDKRSSSSGSKWGL